MLQQLTCQSYSVFNGTALQAYFDYALEIPYALVPLTKRLHVNQSSRPDLVDNVYYETALNEFFWGGLIGNSCASFLAHPSSPDSFVRFWRRRIYKWREMCER